MLTCSVPLWALKYFWDVKQIQQQKLELHFTLTHQGFRRSYPQTPCLCFCGPQRWKASPMERWRISAWLQHLITGLCFFPCKYDFIPAYSSVLMGCGIDWVLQTRAHSSGSKRTASEFLLQDDKRVDFNLDVQNIGYHYVGYESILWVSIVDFAAISSTILFWWEKNMWILQVAIMYFHVFPRTVLSLLVSLIYHPFYIASSLISSFSFIKTFSMIAWILNFSSLVIWTFLSSVVLFPLFLTS